MIDPLTDLLHQLPRLLSNPFYEAAGIIQRRGWCRGYGYQGRVCIGQAIEMVTDGDNSTRTFAIFMALQLMPPGKPIGDFNDDHCHQKRDAVAALMLAGDLWETDERVTFLRMYFAGHRNSD